MASTPLTRSAIRPPSDTSVSTHDDAIRQNLQVMDTAAFALARENNIPIVVFSVHETGAIANALLGQGRATYVMPA